MSDEMAGAVPIDPDLDERLAPLWQPLEIGPVTVRNRLALAPFSTLWAGDSLLTERHLDYYEERARGGLGLLITEQHAADRDRVGFGRHGCSALDPRCVAVFERLADRVHEQGARIFVQLFGPGALDSVGLDVDGWSPIWGAGEVPSAGFGDQPLALPEAEIGGVVANFARAGANVEMGRMDGIELHGARTELIGQFLSPLYNHRTDSYGGSAKARCRLACEIAAAIRGAAPKLALGIQISIDEYMGDAAMTEDVAAEQLDILAASGLFDYFNLSTGNEFTDYKTVPPMDLEEIPVEGFVGRARSVVGGRARLLLNGGVRAVATAAGLVAEGVDLVSMTRPSFADPEIVAKARSGRAREIRPCLHENDCFHAAHLGRPLTCLMNPATGREARWGVAARGRRRPVEARRVLVVGGGPAGMQAAIAAAQNGHRVRLCERRDHLGGHLALLSRLPHRERWAEAIDWFEAELDRQGVETKLGSAIAGEDPEHADADVLLLATGARWATSGFSPANPTVARLPGVEAANVVDVATAAERALEDPAVFGGRVVILDESGEYLPLGLADLLSAAGATVVVAGRHPTIGAHVAMALDHRALFGRLARQGVELLPGRLATGIGERSVSLVELWSGRSTEIDDVDSVVLSLTREPRAELHHRLAERFPDRRLIGDALTPRRTAAVIAEGQSVGFDL